MIKRKIDHNPEKTINIISFNVNGLNSSIDSLCKFLKDNQADIDIVLLQETKFNPSGSKKVVRQMEISMGRLKVLGFKHAFYTHSTAPSQRGRSGVAILTKDLKPIKKTVLKIPDKDAHSDSFKALNNEGRLIVAEFQDFLLASVYIPNAGTELKRMQVKKEYLKELSLYLKDLSLSSKKPLIVGGDVNICHDLDLDCHPGALKLHNSTSGRTPEESAMMDEFLLDLDLVDTYRFRRPSGKMYTWYDNLKERGMRLDYFLVSRGILESVVDSDMYPKETEGSDHIPIRLSLALKDHDGDSDAGRGKEAVNRQPEKMVKILSSK
jgi:exodeoxyribonuclease III